MVTEETAGAEPKIPLSRARVLRSAIELADAQGVEAVTMRNLAQELGVEAMSLYYHVANKEALLDGVVESLLEEVEKDLGGFSVVKGERDWKPILRSWILTARAVMLRHPWAPQVIETRTKMTPILIRYFDSILGVMVEGGVSNDLGHHAMHALGSRALGFNQELFTPEDSAADEEATALLSNLAAQLPYLVGMLSEVTHDDGPEATLGWCDDQTEFEFSLDLILDGLEQKALR